MKLGLMLLASLFIAVPAFATPPTSPERGTAAAAPGGTIDPTPASALKTRTKSNNANERIAPGAPAPAPADHAINTKGMGANDRQTSEPVNPQR